MNKMTSNFGKTACKGISVFVVAAILFSFFPGMILNAGAASAAGYWTDYTKAPSNDGTTYTICTAQELAWVAAQVNEAGNDFTNCTVQLGADINLAGHFWEPIGNGQFSDSSSSGQFNGTFDGKNHTVSNMTITVDKMEYGIDRVGLFGMTYMQIKNLFLKDVSISSGESLYGGTYGGIVGEGGILSNCFVSGNIIINSGYAGGLVGNNGTLFNCGSACNITAGDESVAGGLVGQDGIAYNCFSSGNITCGNGTEYSEAAAGGLIGLGGSIYNCYASGSIAAGSSAYAGGLVGTVSDYAVVKYCYWNESCGAKAGIGMIQESVQDPMMVDIPTPALTSDPSISKTSAYMKSAEFAVLLNQFVTENKAQYQETYGVILLSWKLDSGSNGGYPVLSGLTMDSGSGSASAGKTDITAIPTTSNVLVNGNSVAFEAYTISGNNYFKLRDLAMALSGTEKQFEVGWDGANNAISLTSGKTYTAAGGELKVSGGTAGKTAAPTSSSIYLNGALISVTAYTIGGNNYFKLRDIAAAIDFGVTWDGTTNTIGIDTTSGYTA